MAEAKRIRVKTDQKPKHRAQESYRLNRSFFNEPAIKLLENEPDGTRKVLLYIKMLHFDHCIGDILFRGVREDIFEEMQIYFDESPGIIRSTYEFLHNYGLADIVDNRLFITSPQGKRQRQSKVYVDWRTSVFERDNYTCQICGRRGEYLEAHHKKRWCDHPSLRFDVDNGITLCKECHKSIHSKRRDGLEN